MSLNNIKANYKKGQSGFTIVELLIVIVVIAILAAITIVSYNGVTARANTTSAQAAAGSALKKAELYNAEVNSYPTNPANLTTAASTEVYNLTGVTFTSTEGVDGTAPTSASVLNFFTCTSGVAVEYYDYSSATWVEQTTGACTAPKNYVAG